MPFNIDDKLVIGVSSRALFELEESNQVYESQGVEAYRQFQRERLNEPLAPGPVFAFISELLAFNEALPDVEPIEVVLLSKNDPLTGDRIFQSIEHYGLNIVRAVFTSGAPLHDYIDAFNVSLYLSANSEHVKAARRDGFPAGCVKRSAAEWSLQDGEIRIAFDFDGVLASDESQRVFDAHGLDEFHNHESTHRSQPLAAGPLHRLFHKLGELQSLLQSSNIESPRLRISIVTARSAPANRRMIRTLDEWGLVPDDAFFLGGIEKQRVLRSLRPHIFFDDQESHLQDVFAAVHIPALEDPAPLPLARRPAKRAEREDEDTPIKRAAGK
ncbi:MAG: 5'-nucleotidase [Myxococcota bacterium]